MFPSAANAFFRANAPIEGIVHEPYLDGRGLVTYGMGILADDGTGNPPASFLAEPWHHVDGSPATNAEIAAGWHAVKARQDLKGAGGGSQAFADLTDLRLDDAAIAEATALWLQTRDPEVARYFPGYPTLYADAQLAIECMAYAMGPGFPAGYPKFTAAINAGDFVTASLESAISTVNQTRGGAQAIQKRNALVRQLLTNAANAQAAGSPPSLLWWPGNVDPGSTPTPPDGVRFPTGLVLFVVATAAAAWLAMRGRG